MPKIRVLTLTEPWASLVAIGAKQIETRSRKLLSEPGPLAIHAAKSMPDWAVDEMEFRLFAEPLMAAGILPKHWYTLHSLADRDAIGRGSFQRGHIIALVDLVEVFRFTPETVAPISQTERAYGDYSLNRYGLRLANPRRLVTPIPARGHQGVWYVDLPEDLEYVSTNQPA